MSLEHAIEILTQVCGTTEKTELLIQELHGLDRLTNLEHLHEVLEEHKCVSCGKQMDSEKWSEWPICEGCMKGE